MDTFQGKKNQKAKKTFFGALVLGSLLVFLLYNLPGCHKETTEQARQVSEVKETVAEGTSSASSEPNTSQPGAQVPFHPWHKARVENIRAEMIEQTVENLANFDDAHFATTGMGRHFRTGHPDDEMFRLVHLFRVRRLLEIGRRAPEEVTLVLRMALRQALADWPQSLAQMQKMWAEHPDGFSTEGPTNYEKNQVKAIAATYLLAELGDFNSLPLILQSYRMHTKWIDEHKHYPCTQVPVPQAITLYAMNRLVSAYPVSLLRREGYELHNSYMQWAAEQIPPVRTLTASAWKADYDESDLLGPVLDPEAAALQDQPTIQLAIYPTKFRDGEQMQDGHTQKVAERSKLWFQQLDRFVEATFPNAKSHQPESKQDAGANAEDSAEAEKEVPVHPWHKERVENIGSETDLEVIENLANFDDAHFATTGMGIPFRRGTSRSETNRVVHLFRVRRLFEEGAKAPEQVLTLLRQAYKEALDAWPQARAAHINAAAQAAKAGVGFTLSEPDAYCIANTKAVAMTYLLAELKDYNSLPLLVEGYRLQAKWMDEFPRAAFTRVPVPTTTTLYAIHRLVHGMKPERMSPSARTIRQAYMDWAEKNLPEPTTIDGASWDSWYDESDPYLRIIDPKGKALKGKPRIELPVYPYQWKNGTSFENEGVGLLKISDKEKEWAKLLVAFVEATYKEGTR